MRRALTVLAVLVLGASALVYGAAVAALWPAPSWEQRNARATRRTRSRLG